MARTIKLTKQADKRFDEILIYLNSSFGSSSAKSFIKRTYSFFDIIVDYPQIGTSEDKKKGIYGFVLEKPVKVFYRYTDKKVIILNFFDNRMNPERSNN